MLDFTNYFFEHTRELTEPQRRHLLSLIERIVPAIIDKYVKGAVEHGGNLWDLDCLKEEFQEHIDGLIYNMAEQVKREKALIKKVEEL